MFSKFSVLPTVSKCLKGSKRLLYMSKKFAGAYGTNCQNCNSCFNSHCGLTNQNDQPICSGSRYSLNGSTALQVRLMSSRDSKGDDFDKSIENTSDLKTHNEDSKIDVKVVKRVTRRKSRKESRESYKKGDRYKFSSKRRRSEREIALVPILVKGEKEMGLDFPHKQVPDLVKNRDEHKALDIVKNVGILQSTLPPKKLHVEYIESINLKDIELEKKPSSRSENFKLSPTTRRIKRNLKLASEATQLTNLYLEAKNPVPIQIEKENQTQSSQSEKQTNEPNFRVIVNVDAISPLDIKSNLIASGSNDTKASPKDAQTKPHVIVKTFKKKIRMLPLNAGPKIDTPQKTEDAIKNKSIDKYKPLGLRYTKFSKPMDRVDKWNINSLKSSETSMPRETTPTKKSKIEILNFSEILKPTSLDASPVSEIEAEMNIQLPKIQEVKSVKLPTGFTTLKTNSNIDISKLSEIHKTTNFENTADSIQKLSKPLPVAYKLENRKPHSTTISTLIEKSNSETSKSSKIFKSTTSFDESLEFIAETKNALIPIFKDVKYKSEVEPPKVLENENSKELIRRRNETTRKINEIKLESPLIPMTSNSEVIKPTAKQDTNNVDSPKSLNTSVNSVDTKLEIPITPTYTNVKAKIEQANNEIRLESTKPTLSEPMLRTTISDRPIKSTKSEVFHLKTKSFHSKQSAHAVPASVKPKLISKYKRAEMFKKATEKILGRLELAKKGKKALTNVKDLKTPAIETPKALQDNLDTDKTLKSNAFNTKHFESKNTQNKSITGGKEAVPNVLDTHNTEPKSLSAGSGEYKLLLKFDTHTNEPKLLSTDSGEYKLLPNSDTHKTAFDNSGEYKLLPKLNTHKSEPKAASDNSGEYKLLPKSNMHETDPKAPSNNSGEYKLLLKFDTHKTEPKAAFDNSGEYKLLLNSDAHKTEAKAVSDNNGEYKLNTHKTEPKATSDNSGEYKLLPKSNTHETEPKAPSNNSGEYKLLPKSNTHETEPKSPSDNSGENKLFPKLDIQKTEPKSPSDNRSEYKLIPKLDTYKTETKTLSANSGKYKLLPKLDTDILKVKKVPTVLETDIKMEKESSTANVGNFPPPSIYTLKAKNTPPINKINQSLNMAKNKEFTKSEPENISPPPVENLKAKNSPPPSKMNQTLNMTKNKKFTKSEQVENKADIWAMQPRPQDNSKNLTNSALNDHEDTTLSRLKVPKRNVDSPLSSLKRFSKSDGINFSATNISTKSKLVEPMKPPIDNVDKVNQETDKPKNYMRKKSAIKPSTIKESPSKPATNAFTIGENIKKLPAKPPTILDNPSKPVTSSSTAKYLGSTSPSHYPKNMFGEFITPEQLKKSQEKLKAFQTNLNVTSAQTSPKIVGNQKSTTGNTKRPDNVNRPGPTKKPESDGGSGNQGGDNSGGGEVIHGTEGNFVNFWSTAAITTIYLAMSIMIYLMKELSPLNPWHRFFTALTREQTAAILRLQPATYDKDNTNSNLPDNTEKDNNNIITECIENVDQANLNNLGDHKIVKVDKNSKFEDV